MAEATETYTIRGALNALDEDVYADDGGYPGHAALGTELINNDRDLHAYLRTVPVNTAFPDNDTLDFAFYHGNVFGPWPVIPTPGNREGEWYLRVNIDNSAAADALTIVPYVLGMMPYEGRGRANAAIATTVAGTGSDVTLGPYTMPLPHEAGILEVGFVLESELDTVTSSSTGDLHRPPLRNSLRAAAGSVFPNVTPPTRRVVRLLEPSGGSDRILTGWHDIVSVQTTDAARDTAVIWPPLDLGNNVPPDLQWEIRNIWGAEVLSFTLREAPIVDPLF